MSSISHFIDTAYPSVAQNYHKFNWLRERAMLAAKNNAVHEIRNHILDMIPGIVTEYNSIDTVDADDAVNFPTEFT